MIRFSKTLLTLALLVTLTPIVGCSAKARVTGVKNTFLEDVDISNKLPNMPFDHSWISPRVAKDDYKFVIIKPVRLDLLPSNEWKSSASPVLSTKEEFDAQAKKIAEYLREQLIGAIALTVDHRVMVTQKPGPNVATLEIAITELEFSHPIARAAALAAPIPGTGAALSTITDPHAAIALRLSDSNTGKLLATVADRRFPPTRIVDLNKLTVSSSIREVCHGWAISIADALDKGRFGKVSAPPRVTLKPW